MCGICGWIKLDGLRLEYLQRMNNLASHRGPDGEGYWYSDSQNFEFQINISEKMDLPARIALGHKRLAIIDLSVAGLQPMPSSDQVNWIAYNGEVYNYLELRSDLIKLGYEFRTGTDTEVILASYQEWGVGCFARFNGMWGLVLVDLRERKVIFSRDRLGVKPLYLWKKNNILAFASEIKQFYALPEFVPTADLDTVVEYIDTGYQMPQSTFFEGIEAFPAGCWGEVDIDHPDFPVNHSYWFPEDINPQNIPFKEAKKQTRFLFEDAVKIRLRSDVPVGICLSGGLDSSTVFGQVQRLKNFNSDSTYAFSAAYNNKHFDETEYIEKVMNRFGGRSHFTFPDANTFLLDLNKFIYHHDEPPGSLSQYAAWAVMRLAKEHCVPVLLNGQGGDELFSGYWPAYYLFLRQNLFTAPLSVVSHLIGCLLPGGNPDLFLQIWPHLQQYNSRKNRKNRDILLSKWESRGYTLNANWAIQAQMLLSSQYRISEIRQIHLPRLLKWDDRNSMAFSIEGRYPFLDYRLVEWSLTLPTQINLHNGWNKYMIRGSFGDLLPPEIQWRRSKIGFETPQSEWIRTTLYKVLIEWSSTPSKRLAEIVNTRNLKLLGDELLNSRYIHKMDERQFLLIRLFLLEKWLDVFQVNVP